MDRSTTLAVMLLKAPAMVAIQWLAVIYLPLHRSAFE
jgi:hypothetical protein